VVRSWRRDFECKASTSGTTAAGMLAQGMAVAASRGPNLFSDGSHGCRDDDVRKSTAARAWLSQIDPQDGAVPQSAPSGRVNTIQRAARGSIRAEDVSVR
jgi:hypothetical protein